MDRGRPREIRGIAFLSDTGEVEKTAAPELIEDLDTLPFPARDLYDYDAFRAAGWLGVRYPLISRLPLPVPREFCQPTLNMIFGRMRKRGPEDVALEMAELAETTRPLFIYKDDTLSANGLDWFARFQDPHCLSANGVTQRWKCNTRVRQGEPKDRGRDGSSGMRGGCVWRRERLTADPRTPTRKTLMSKHHQGFAL